MTTDIETIRADLATAERDVTRYQQLQTAEARREELRSALSLALKNHDRAMAAANKAAQKARFEGLSNIKVTEKECGQGGGILRSSFTITWTGQKYDMNAMASVPHEFTSPSFSALPDNVLEFLLVQHPEQMPDSIMALAPNDPEAALEQYRVGLRRGCIRA